MLRNKRSFSRAIVTREVRNNDAVIQKKQANLFFFKKLNMLKRLQSKYLYDLSKFFTKALNRVSESHLSFTRLQNSICTLTHSRLPALKTVYM